MERDGKKNENGKSIKAVMYIPQTAHSKLAKEIRKIETGMEAMTGAKFKIVERSGNSLVGTLHHSNPWAGLDCQREGCLLCSTKIATGKNLSQSCSKRNIVYETWCESCREEDEKKFLRDGKEKKDLERMPIYKYIGESARSAFERGIEHQRDKDQLNSGSHMLKHMLEKHSEAEVGTVKFMMKVVKFHQSAFERQIHESVLIQNNRHHHIMNSKSEYNRCALPRIGLKLGDQAFKKKKKEKDEKKEEMLENKIKEMKKKRNAERKTEAMGPTEKKKKMEDLNDVLKEVKRKEKRKGQIIRESEKRRNQRKISSYYKPKNCPPTTCLVEVASGGEDKTIQLVGEELAGVHEGEITNKNSQREKEKRKLSQFEEEKFSKNLNLVKQSTPEMNLTNVYEHTVDLTESSVKKTEEIIVIDDVGVIIDMAKVNVENVETENYIEECTIENVENNDDVSVNIQMAEVKVNVEKVVTENYIKECIYESVENVVTDNYIEECIVDDTDRLLNEPYCEIETNLHENDIIEVEGSEITHSEIWNKKRLVIGMKGERPGKRTRNGSGLWLRKGWYETKILHHGWRGDLTSDEFEKKGKEKELNWLQNELIETEILNEVIKKLIEKELIELENWLKRNCIDRILAEAMNIIIRKDKEEKENLKRKKRKEKAEEQKLKWRKSWEKMDWSNGEKDEMIEEMKKNKKSTKKKGHFPNRILNYGLGSWRGPRFQPW